MGIEKYFKKNKMLSDKQFDCLINWHQARTKTKMIKKKIKEYLKTQLFLDMVTTLALTIMLAALIYIILLQL